MSFDSIKDGQKKIIVILVLTALVLIIYWQVQNFEFINYDDQLYVTSNDLTQSSINLKSIMSVLRDTQTGNWHPLTMLSHMLDWQIYGWKAGGHHWTNVIIHIFNAVLLFLLFNQMTGAIWRSAAVAALFALHPINVESVAWVAERKNVLSTFFWIITMIFYVRYSKAPDWKRYLPVLICFTLGLMSKAMLVTLPFVLLCIDFWPLKRTAISFQQEEYVPKSKTSLLVVEKIPLLMMSALFVYITVNAQKTLNAFHNPEVLPLWSRIANSFVSYSRYIQKTIWPTDLEIFYPFSFFPLWQIILSAVLILAITAAAFKNFKKYPSFTVGWFWFTGTLIPVIGLVQVGRQSMADRYAYVPLIGLFLIFAWTIPQITSKLRHAKIYISSALIIFIFLMAVSSFHRVSVWQNTTTLFEEALRINPRNYFAYNILGLEQADKGHFENALFYYSESLKINPQNDQAYTNAGNLFLKLGKYKEAYYYYQKAISINARQTIAYHNLGVLFAINSKYEEAIDNFDKSLAIMPDYINAHVSMGIVLIETGNVEDAIAHFEKALSLNPRHIEAQKKLNECREMRKMRKSIKP